MIIWELATSRMVAETLGFHGPPFDWDGLAHQIADGKRPDITDLVRSRGEEFFDVATLLGECWSLVREDRPSSADVLVPDPPMLSLQAHAKFWGL